MTETKKLNILSQIEALLDKQSICNGKCHNFANSARVESDANKRQRLQRLSEFYAKKSSEYAKLSTALKLFI